MSPMGTPSTETVPSNGSDPGAKKSAGIVELVKSILLPPDESDPNYIKARDWIEAAVKHAKFLAHGPLLAIDEPPNAFEADIFFFSNSGGN